MERASPTKECDEKGQQVENTAENTLCMVLADECGYCDCSHFKVGTVGVNRKRRIEHDKVE